MKRFPEIFYQENPFSPDIPDSIVIPQGQDLPEPISEKEAAYFNYFQTIDERLKNLARETRIEHFSEWIKRLNETPKTLVIHDIERFDPSDDFSNYYINFNNQYDLELISDEFLIRTLNLPKSLQEVLKLGKIWVEGVPLQRCFCHPKDVKPANKEEGLQYFIENSEDLISEKGIPIADLKTFYVDSGCWLMYDNNEIVYCGGYECGDFYKTSQNLEETINRIFKKLNEYVIDPRFGFNPDIENFVKRQE